MERLILTPCPPKKHCLVCEGRLNAAFGSADKTARYRHQASEAGLRAMQATQIDVRVALVTRAASYANLVLGPPAEV
jgi:hypothetical protein